MRGEKAISLDAVPEAPGDWAVDHAVCMACGAPPAVAPDLMGFGVNHASPEHFQCYFKRQPRTPAEHNQAFKAASVSCCAAVRYCGADPALQRRMTDLDESTRGPVPMHLMQAAVAKRSHALRMLVIMLLAALVATALAILRVLP